MRVTSLIGDTPKLEGRGGTPSVELLARLRKLGGPGTPNRVSRRATSATGETAGEYTSRLATIPVLRWHPARPRTTAGPTPQLRRVALRPLGAGVPGALALLASKQWHTFLLFAIPFHFLAPSLHPRRGKRAPASYNHPDRKSTRLNS